MIWRTANWYMQKPEFLVESKQSNHIYSILYALSWYVQYPETVLENETHKLLRDFKIKMDHINSARRLVQVISKKKKKEKKSRTYKIVHFAVPGKTERKQKER